MFGALYAAEGSADVLSAVAYEFSPRIEVYGPHEILVDLTGLTRLFGDAATIARELQRTMDERRLAGNVAIARTRTAARLLVRAAHAKGSAGERTIVASSNEAEVLAPLPIDLLAHIASNEPNAPNDLIGTFRRWGLRTLGDLALLLSDDVAARLGQEGVRWQRLARGEDWRPLVPAVPAERFEQAFDLEWPIDGLEPLAFVLARLMEPLSAHLERRGRGAAVLHVRLHLVTRALHERSLQLPTPIRDARTLRTLALLDLESNPPSAAIDRVVVAVDPTPGRVLQFSLLTRPLPSPEQLSTLTARLAALMGEGRCGSAVEADSWQPGAFSMKPFAPVESDAECDRPQRHRGAEPAVGALRRFRFPVPARVRVEDGKPVHVAADRPGVPGGKVDVCAGPWRSSGAWWTVGGAPIPPTPPTPSQRWDRDEWDVALVDGAMYRLFRKRDGGGWFIEGVVD